METLFGSIIDGSKSARQAVADLVMEIAKAQMLKGIMALPGMGGLSSFIGGLLAPGYASGGMHGGGLRIVGERGPELEATGPSRIWSADQTRTMLAGQQPGGGAAPRSGGQSVLRVELSPALAGEILKQAADQSIQISRQAVTAGIGQFNRVLPTRVRQINAYPRMR